MLCVGHSENDIADNTDTTGNDHKGENGGGAGTRGRVSPWGSMSRWLSSGGDGGPCDEEDKENPILDVPDVSDNATVNKEGAAIRVMNGDLADPVTAPNDPVWQTHRDRHMYTHGQKHISRHWHAHT